MQRVSTTAVVLVGDEPGLPDTLRHAMNVRVVEADPADDALKRASDVWSEVRRTRSAYAVYDADPLELVLAGWTRRFDGSGPPGELEVAVTETLARWRSGSIELPDYYLAIDPDRWTATRRHFYLGVLASAAPARVVVTSKSETTNALGRLKGERWWPPLETLIGDLASAVPDLVGLHGTSDSPPRASHRLVL